MPELTEKQQLFVKSYLTHFNATRAALEAGYSEDTAPQIGWDILQKDYIQDTIKAQLTVKMDKLEISGDRILSEIAKVAFADLGDYVLYDNDGLVIKSSNMVDTGPVQEVSITQGKEGPNKKIRLYDKLKALEMLGRSKGLFQDTTKIVLPDEYKMIKEIIEKLEGLPDEELKAIAAGGDDHDGSGTKNTL